MVMISFHIAAVDIMCHRLDAREADTGTVGLERTGLTELVWFGTGVDDIPDVELGASSSVYIYNNTNSDDGIDMHALGTVYTFVIINND